MRKILVILALAAITLPLAAQDDVALDPEYGGRFSIEMDKMIMKGLHFSLEEEVRMAENFTSLDRLQATASVSYKVLPCLKVGLGYALINPYSNTDVAFKSARHRVMLDATGTYRSGDWTFQLTERLQMTYHSGDMNEYQSARAAWTVKSRLQAKYRLTGRWTPYAYIELRNTLNAPVIDAYLDDGKYVTAEGYESAEAGWFISGWNGMYVNRLRASLGADYMWDKRNTISFYVLADRVSDKVVDANAEGTKLKSYTRETGFIGHVGVAYTYSF